MFSMLIVMPCRTQEPPGAACSADAPHTVSLSSHLDLESLPYMGIPTVLPHGTASTSSYSCLWQHFRLFLAAAHTSADSGAAADSTQPSYARDNSVGLAHCRLA